MDSRRRRATPRAAALTALALALVLGGATRADDAVEGQDPRVVDLVANLFQNPDAFNSITQPMVQGAVEGPLGFLDDLRLEFKYFDGDDSSEMPGLGLGYGLTRQIENWGLIEECEEVCKRLGLDLDVRAKGNVAFDEEKNPDDFLETSVSLGAFFAHGGPKSQTREWRDRSAELALKLASATEQEELERIETEIGEHVTGALDDLVVVDLASVLGYETNQDFSARQSVYGGRLGLSLQGYSGLYATRYREAGWIAWLNLPDYLPALTRALTGSADCGDGGFCFVPRGVTFPLVTLGLAAIHPEKDVVRRAVDGSLDLYPRFDVEVAFNTLALRLGDTEIDFSVNYRFYQEVDASRALRRAGLDEFSYLALALGPNNGLFVSYATGQLPFDQRSDDVVQVGLRADIEAIKEFLF